MQETSRYEPQKHDAVEHPIDRRSENSSTTVNNYLYRIPSAKERQEKTLQILQALQLEDAFSKVLSPEEMKGLQIRIDGGSVFETMPPIYTTSIGLRFLRGGKWIGMEEGMQWRQEEKKEPVNPYSMNDGQPFFTENQTRDAIEGVPRTLVAEKLRSMLARIKSGDLQEKPPRWDEDISELINRSDVEPEKKNNVQEPVDHITKSLDRIASEKVQFSLTDIAQYFGPGHWIKEFFHFLRKTLNKEQYEAEENMRKGASYVELLAELERKAAQGDHAWEQPNPAEVKGRLKDFGETTDKAFGRVHQASGPLGRSLGMFGLMAESLPKLLAYQMDALRSVVYIRRQLKSQELTIDPIDQKRDTQAATSLGENYEKWHARNPHETFATYLSHLSTFIKQEKKVSTVTLEDTEMFSREFAS